MAKLLETAVLLESAGAASTTDLFLSICLNIIHVLVRLQSLRLRNRNIFRQITVNLPCSMEEGALASLFYQHCVGRKAQTMLSFASARLSNTLENQRRDGAGRFFRLSEVYHENA